MRLREDLRLPGVYFLPPPQPGGLTLPPLDVPAFIGFAERGPLNLPVAVEDPGAFASVFGGDLPLAVERHTRQDAPSPPEGGAWPASVGASSGQMVYASLPRCVHAFFANGGRRCYVVRVAGPQAQAARFHLPGMVALGSSTTPARLAAAAASSPGAWANQVRLSTRLQAIPLPASLFTWQDGAEGPLLSARSARLTRNGRPLLLSGDVLRLTLANDSRWLAVTDRLVAGHLSGAPALDDTQVRLRAIYPLWDELPGTQVLASSLLTVDGVQDLQSTGALAFTAGRVNLPLHPDDAGLVRPGDALLLRLSDGRSVLLAVEDVVGSTGTASPPLSPPAPALWASGAGLLQIFPAAAPAGPVTLASLEVLRFDLLPRLGDQRLAPATELAFNAGGDRFWGDVLLLETSLRRQSAAQPNRARAQTSQDSRPVSEAHAAAEWFRATQWDAYGLAPADVLTDLPQPDSPADPLAALAGLFAPLGSDVALPYAERITDPRAAYQQLSEQPNLIYLPLSMPVFFQENDPRQFTGPDENYLGDDDLIEFDPRVFQDPRLAFESARTLMATAVDLHEIQGRRLYGLHSLLFIDEVALVTAPDAVQPVWAEAEALPSPPPPRPAAPPPPADCPPEPQFAACDRPPRLTAVEPYFGPLDQETPLTILGEGFTNSLETTVWLGRRQASLVTVISTQELRCLAPTGLLEGPVTVRVENANGSAELPGAFIYQAAATALNPLPIVDLDAPEPEADEETFLEIHRALLNFCQARADCLAILSLPRRYDLPRCLAWQDALRRQLGLPPMTSMGISGFGLDELSDIADLSFAAVYHPWVLIAAGEAASRAETQAIPPDGAICGLIASRERRRGVWVAPANEIVRDVVGLRPEFTAEEWATLFARRFNLVRHEPDGFRPMSAHTLSDRRDLFQVSVRRLMILLRKVALRLGMDFVFESNHERFREGARVVLEEMLRDLYQRGAFAGASREQAFRVITDASVNPPQSIEAGRFIVVIQVAPSQPMEFITVQLTRTGEGELLSTEI